MNKICEMIKEPQAPSIGMFQSQPSSSQSVTLLLLIQSLLVLLFCGLQLKANSLQDSRKRSFFNHSTPRLNLIITRILKALEARVVSDKKERKILCD